MCIITNLFLYSDEEQNKMMKKVTFSPQLTNVREYNSPYCDPLFIHDVWKLRIKTKYSNVAFNYAEEVSPKYNDAILCTYFLYYFRLL